MYVMVDIEANGPIPSVYSMFWFGAVVVKPDLKNTFDGRMRPLDGGKIELSSHKGETVCVGYELARVDHQEVMTWPDPDVTMAKFGEWLDEQQSQFKDDRVMLISDNNGYDAMWIAWYFHKFFGRNPFGHSSTNLGSLYKGLVKDTFKNFKHLRKTKHTHDPVDDAMGNAEALLHMKEKMGLRIKL